MNTIQLSHGSGGKQMQRLITEVILKYLGSNALVLDDAAELNITASRLAFTTDSFVVKPIFFPGGDIGSLAVSGTVNDLLMKGARPKHISVGLIIEEGFGLNDFETILKSMQTACKQAQVTVVTGDTKVVGRGEADGIFINTSGVGEIFDQVHVSGTNAKPGDVIIVSGDIGRHGMAVMTKRHGLKLEGNMTSDAIPLTSAVVPLLTQFGEQIHVLRDPTRGGVATTLNEIAEASQVQMLLDESLVPVKSEVQAVSDLLGFDPLYLPCEGRFLCLAEANVANDIINLLHTLSPCESAEIIGTVTQKSQSPGVMLKTLTGGQRILDMPVGELLPRIC